MIQTDSYNGFASTGRVTVGGTGTNGNTIWINPLYPYHPQRASSCPFCTPRCPHGYPLDTQPCSPISPWIVYC